MSKRMTPMSQEQLKGIEAITDISMMKTCIIEDVIDGFEFPGWKGITREQWKRKVTNARSIAELQKMLYNLYMTSNGLGVIK